MGMTIVRLESGSRLTRTCSRKEVNKHGADRHRRAPGKAAVRQSAKQRARERIAAEQAARRRAEARRRFLVTGGAITAVLAAFAGLVAVELTAGSAHQGGRESAGQRALCGRSP